MKYITLILLLISCQLPAANVDCYAGKTRVYHAVDRDVVLTGNTVIVNYGKYYDVLFIKHKNAPNCLITHWKP